MHGYSPQEMIGMRVWDVYDPELPEPGPFLLEVDDRGLVVYEFPEIMARFQGD